MRRHEGWVPDGADGASWDETAVNRLGMHISVNIRWGTNLAFFFDRGVGGHDWGCVKGVQRGRRTGRSLGANAVVASW